MTKEETKAKALAKALVKAIANIECGNCDVSTDILTAEIDMLLLHRTESCRKAVKHFMTYYEGD